MRVDGGHGRNQRSRVSALVLAAGRSQRAGGVNKLLSELHGLPVLLHAITAARDANVSEVVVVTGHEADAVRAVADRAGVRCVHNPAYAAGLSTSLCAGIAALASDATGVLVCLGDMPFVSAADLDALVDAFEASGCRDVCVPVSKSGQRGNPVLWPARTFSALRGLSGDAGARALLANEAATTRRVPMRGDAVLQDIDTLADLARLGGPIDGR